jgi:hypothetical protein
LADRREENNLGPGGALRESLLREFHTMSLNGVTGGSGGRPFSAKMTIVMPFVDGRGEGNQRDSAPLACGKAFWEGWLCSEYEESAGQDATVSEIRPKGKKKQQSSKASPEFSLLFFA